MNDNSITIYYLQFLLINFDSFSFFRCRRILFGIQWQRLRMFFGFFFSCVYIVNCNLLHQSDKRTTTRNDGVKMMCSCSRVMLIIRLGNVFFFSISQQTFELSVWTDFLCLTINNSSKRVHLLVKF